MNHKCVVQTKIKRLVRISRFSHKKRQLHSHTLQAFLLARDSETRSWPRIQVNDITPKLVDLVWGFCVVLNILCRAIWYCFSFRYSILRLSHDSWRIKNEDSLNVPFWIQIYGWPVMLTLLNSNQPAFINWHNLSTAQKNDLFLALKSKFENRGILSKIARYLDMGLRNLSKLFGIAAK